MWVYIAVKVAWNKFLANVHGSLKRSERIDATVDVVSEVFRVIGFTLIRIFVVKYCVRSVGYTLTRIILLNESCHFCVFSEPNLGKLRPERIEPSRITRVRFNSRISTNYRKGHLSRVKKERVIRLSLLSFFELS